LPYCCQVLWTPTQRPYCCQEFQSHVSSGHTAARNSRAKCPAAKLLPGIPDSLPNFPAAARLQPHLSSCPSAAQVFQTQTCPAACCRQVFQIHRFNRPTAAVQSHLSSSPLLPGTPDPPVHMFNMSYCCQVFQIPAAKCNYDSALFTSARQTRALPRTSASSTLESRTAPAALSSLNQRKAEQRSHLQTKNKLKISTSIYD
jgi:hypothetical protein